MECAEQEGDHVGAVAVDLDAEGIVVHAVGDIALHGPVHGGLVPCAVDHVGEAVLGGGRYDTLLENFGKETGATGFGINISVIADKLAKNFESGNAEKAKCIVHYESETLSKALEYAENCADICELSCFDNFEDTLAYAKTKGIEKVVRICTGNITEVRDI